MLRLITAFFVSAGYTQAIQFDHGTNDTQTIIIWIVLFIVVFVLLSLDRWIEERG